MDALSIFARQVRNRSAENERVMKVLARMGAAGQMIAVLRQELDSTVRVVYLLAQEEPRRTELIEASVSGVRWKKANSKAPVTDKEMVDLGNTLEGWCRSVYKFGCAFIHLSNMHDYNDRDPLSLISNEEREEIIRHCRAYHGGPNNATPTFSDLIPYIPKAFFKVSANLDCYLESLERGDNLDHVL
ncbi:hypothetical protein EZJ19_03650 [Parasulfuritortus cantonensis]|uniref:Uncharacterized protein n=1 Tax=Parasulfuritortus cantonensis TaxID=2528202 RepID=A0A4V2NWM8_9PROT|nr:hypothetical protein [Parasulfuritortus cantonensis]TCJ18012.1 hypothetical protein EZJ19_03650 [Parasulfuritortus cantonensis]